MVKVSRGTIAYRPKGKICYPVLLLESVLLRLDSVFEYFSESVVRLLAQSVFQDSLLALSSDKDSVLLHSFSFVFPTVSLVRRSILKSDLSSVLKAARTDGLSHPAQ